ncbi:hypothetical protein [Dyadobacter sp. 3J3]|uniref:hypothetical protein n=1 Tax=Dyadobacter sp. 3J3 TaxID=2606600 RepID=UPI00135B5E57|nr:hypothetical protein [Dyadobacter sp. 3J3]
MPDPIKCPKCSSTQISSQQKGYSTGKAAAGVILTGGVGLLAGLHGSSDINVFCLNCGNKWNPKTYFQQKERERTQAAAVYKEKWKNNFYRLYESGNMDEATEILKIQRGAMLNEIGVDKIYSKLKSEDNFGLVLKIILFSLMAAMIIWFLSCID